MMITLLFSSINTYNGIVKKCWILNKDRKTTNITFISIWTISLLLSGLFVIMKIFAPSFHMVKVTAINFLIIGISAVFYVKVTRFLKISKNETTSVVGRAESQRTIEKAIFVLRMSSIVYSTASLVNVLSTLLLYFFKDFYSFHVCMWAVRLTYIVGLLLEPCMFFYKHPDTRRSVLSYINCCGGRRNDGAESRASKT